MNADSRASEKRGALQNIFDSSGAASHYCREYRTSLMAQEGIAPKHGQPIPVSI
jgi:hypothetical protein